MFFILYFLLSIVLIISYNSYSRCCVVDSLTSDSSEYANSFSSLFSSISSIVIFVCPQNRFFGFEENNLPIYYLDFEKDGKFPSQKLCRYNAVRCLWVSL